MLRTCIVSIIFLLTLILFLVLILFIRSLCSLFSLIHFTYYLYREISFATSRRTFKLIPPRHPSLDLARNFLVWAVGLWNGLTIEVKSVLRLSDLSASYNISSTLTDRILIFHFSLFISLYSHFLSLFSLHIFSFLLSPSFCCLLLFA